MSYSLMRPKNFGLGRRYFATKPVRQLEVMRKVPPPADIFLYGIPEGTTEQDIVDDLNEADIKRTVGDIVQISKPNES